MAVLDRADTGPFKYLRADLADDAGVRAAVADATSLGGLDVLVNNAGVGAQGGVEANDDDEWHRVLDVNVVGLVRVTRAALPALRAVGARRDRQHLLDRGDRRAARTARSTRRARAPCCR